MAEINDELYKQLESMAKKKARDLAKDARDKISNKYMQILVQYYDEYDPDFYYRHYDKNPSMNNINKFGLYKSFRRVLSDPPNKGVFYGGININNSNMYTDYNEKNDRVLQSFLDGYHGHESLGITSLYKPYEKIIEYRDELKKKYEGWKVL